MCIYVEHPPGYAIERIHTVRIVSQSDNAKELAYMLRPKVRAPWFSSCNLFTLLESMLRGFYLDRLRHIEAK